MSAASITDSNEMDDLDQSMPDGDHEAGGNTLNQCTDTPKGGKSHV